MPPRQQVGPSSWHSAMGVADSAQKLSPPTVTQATLLVAQVDDAQTLFRELGDSKAFPVATRFYELIGALAPMHDAIVTAK